MNQEFFQRLEEGLATERLDAYRQDGVAPIVTLARYLWNIALCESLYSPLQLAEIALRNSIHRTLTSRHGREDWYVGLDDLSTWQATQLESACTQIQKRDKEVTPGRVVAELHFGFWTGFFNKTQAQTGLGHALASQAFPNAPRSERNLRKLDARWKRIRDLRNRVFHHERVIHWSDLDAQHEDLLEIIRWINPELQQVAIALDRYRAIRHGGVDPWLEKIRLHWPTS